MTMQPHIPHLADPILVVGGYGYRNVGDEAILASLLHVLAGRRVTVLSRLPAETAFMHGVRAIPLSRALPAVRRHRTIVIGGGGLFGPDMGAIGRLLPYAGLGVALAGRNVALYGVDIDPGMTGPGAHALRALAERAVSVLVRDGHSAEALLEWGVEAAIGPDLSAWLAPEPIAVGGALLRSAGLRMNRPIVGVSLTAVDRDLAEPALEAVAGAMEALPDLQFCFIPMSQHPWVARHNDMLMARRLRARQPRLRILDGMHHPARIMAAYRNLSVLIGMRYHSLLFAERASVPLIAIPYADKCRTWLAEHGHQPTPPTADAVIDAVRTLVPVEEVAS